MVYKTFARYREGKKKIMRTPLIGWESQTHLGI